MKTKNFSIVLFTCVVLVLSSFIVHSAALQLNEEAEKKKENDKLIDQAIAKNELSKISREVFGGASEDKIKELIGDQNNHGQLKKYFSDKGPIGKLYKNENKALKKLFPGFESLVKGKLGIEKDGGLKVHPDEDGSAELNVEGQNIKLKDFKDGEFTVLEKGSCGEQSPCALINNNLVEISPEESDVYIDLKKIPKDLILNEPVNEGSLKGKGSLIVDYNKLFGKLDKNKIEFNSNGLFFSGGLPPHESFQSMIFNRDGKNNIVIDGVREAQQGDSQSPPPLSSLTVSARGKEVGVISILKD